MTEMEPVTFARAAMARLSMLIIAPEKREKDCAPPPRSTRSSKVKLFGTVPFFRTLVAQVPNSIASSMSSVKPP